MKKSVFFVLFLLFLLFFVLSCQKSSDAPTNPGPASTDTPVPATPTKTPYPTSTPNTTPGGDNVSGTLYLPAPQPGKPYWVVADYDIDYPNGTVSVLRGICGSGTSITYAFTVPDGTYYLYAGVDINGTNFENGPINGDYLGYYGGSGYNPPGFANAVVSGPSSFDITLAAVPTFTPTNTVVPTVTPTPGSNGTIAGNLYLPSAQNGDVWWIGADNDLNPINGLAGGKTGYCGTSTTVPYTIQVPAGTYYVYAWIDANGSMQDGCDVGDYFGSYGATYPNFPASPNVVVVTGNTTNNININMGVGVANVSCTVNYNPDATGADGGCAADNDYDGGNGYMSIHYVPYLPSGTSYTFQLCVPLPGMYYFYSLIDKVDPPDIFQGPNTGDFYGIYGSPTAVYINPANSYSFTFNTNVIP